MAVPVASSVRTSLTLAGCRAFATSSPGLSDHGTTSIFSPRSSFTTMRTREPFGPTQAPTGSTPGSFELTAIFERCPGSRATALDLDDALLDLGHLEREQRLQQARVRARHDDLRSLGARGAPR